MAKTTIKEVASLAGVSPSSVSRSLRGVGGVSSSTTQRVRQAAEHLGYSVSPAAYRLATGRAGTVAIAPSPTIVTRSDMGGILRLGIGDCEVHPTTARIHRHNMLIFRGA